MPNGVHMQEQLRNGSLKNVGDVWVNSVNETVRFNWKRRKITCLVSELYIKRPYAELVHPVVLPPQFSDDVVFSRLTIKRSASFCQTHRIRHYSDVK